MKTPREILLEQHRSASARLDALRANVVTKMAQPKSSAAPEKISLRHVWMKIWKELFWPCRHAWTGMAALWLVLWVINSGLSGSPDGTANARRSLASADAEAMQEQRRLLAELIPPGDIQPTELPKRRPRPRSQTQAHWQIG